MPKHYDQATALVPKTQSGFDVSSEKIEFDVPTGGGPVKWTEAG